MNANPSYTDKSFHTKRCRFVGLSGINLNFSKVSQSIRQVIHVLLTRSPLRIEARRKREEGKKREDARGKKETELRSVFALRSFLASCFLHLTILPLTSYVLLLFSARLACLRHAASVHPEPGSNSQINICFAYEYEHKIPPIPT